MLNFSQAVIKSYGGEQDKNSEFEIQDFGQTLAISGNGWKKIDFSYNITKHTILEFEFKSTQLGDIHGIGFDTDDKISGNFTFQLYGTQDWGINDFQTYSPTQGNEGWVKYRISVGEFYTGSMNYLTFTNDHDTKFPTAESLFRNVRVFESEPEAPLAIEPRPVTVVDLNQYGLTSYGGQDRVATVDVSENGSTIELEGNTWKKLDFAYDITADTVLEFEFRSDREGDIHAIGFDSDDKNSSNQTFKLYGTQAWGITDFDNYAEMADSGEWQSYRINVGDFFTGSMSYLTFVNDYDVKNADAESFFRNIRVYEEQPERVIEAGNLSGLRTFAENLTLNGPDHVYRFTLDETSDFNAILEGLSENANVILRRENSLDDSILQTATQEGLQTELLYANLVPGEYSLLIEAEYGLSTDYELILSASPDAAATAHSLNVSTATYLGGLSDDQAAAVEVSPRHELIVAGNFGNSLETAHTLLGATTSSSGQIARLSASGREILSVTHLGDDVNDMDVNRVNGNIAVGGDFGITVLNATGDQVLWSWDFGTAVERVAIANDGSVVTLHNKIITTWTPTGEIIAQAQQRRSYVADVAIHPETNLVYVVGFDNKTNTLDNNNPVQVAFLNAFEPQNLNHFVWQNWGFAGDELTTGQNDMADTRGYRVTVGRDGLLYFLGEVAGGNSIFRWNGRDRSTPTLVKYDAYNDPYNSMSPHQAYYARINPADGAVMQGQLAFSRLNGEPGAIVNAFRVDEGAIAADETGNIYISGQGFSKIQDRDINQINGQTVGEYVKSDLTTLVVANDFQSRKLWTPFTEDVGRGQVQGIAVGHGRAAILGTVSQGTVITTEDAINPEPFNLNPYRSSDSGDLRDVYLATWGTDSLSEFVSLQAGTVDADELLGGRSADLFVGGEGGDRLTGNGGADAFRYESLVEGGDVITDFGIDDQILVSAEGFGLVVGEAAQLVLGASATSNDAAFRYESGILSFDPNGMGGAAPVVIAELQGSPGITAGQIQIVV